MAGSLDANSMAQDMSMAMAIPSDSPTTANHPAARHNANVTIYQTTGPDAYTSPIPAPGGVGPALNPRSCVTCRRRKVRCDKQMPCSNCRRALIPCVFPAPGRAPRQPRPKDPNAPPKTTTHREAELVKRLKKLEGIVEELSGQIEVESSGRGASSAGSPDAPHLTAASRSASLVGQAYRGASDSYGQSANDGDVTDSHSPLTRQDDVNTKLGRLVLNDHKGSTRYVTNGFWSKLNDELKSLREDVQRETDESEESDYEEGQQDSPESVAAVSNHQAFIFGYSSADVDLTALHPLPCHVTYLWSVYQENVDPLVKVLHIPTMESVMRDARKNPASLAPGMQALVFAIYYGAIISLEPDEVMTNLGESADKLLKQFRFALEQALSKAHFLNTSEICVVQAFTLFLTTVRRNDDSRFSWTLTGLVIRLAHGMGLHRDGTQFDLTPFETEMRRRLWWNILKLDLRSAEEIGTELTVADAMFDTQLPLNINDADISPESIEPPAPRTGPTDLACTLVRCEILKVSRRLMTDMASGDKRMPPAQREEMLIDVYRHVEGKFLKFMVTESDPLWWVAAMVARIIMSKMCLVIYQHEMFPGAPVELSGEIRQRLYVASMEVVELGHKLNVDPRAKQYRWLFLTYTNWHAVAFNLLETCRRPWTALVERSWEAVSGFERDPVHAEKTADHAVIFLPMRKLFLRAQKHRETELARLRNNLTEARRLDFQERMNPAEARFGPLPGYENKMDQVREKWWGLLREGNPNAGPVPTATPNTWPRATNPAVTEGSPASVPSSGSAPAYPQQGGIPANIADVAMDYMDEFMSRPSTNISEFFPIDNIMSPDPNDPKIASMLPPMDGPSTMQNHAPNNQMMGQQVGQTQAGGIQDDENLPPYLWSGAYGETTGMVADDVAVGDMDMGDFDWQNWGQSLQSLDMGGV